MPKNASSPASKADIEQLAELLDSRLADASALAEEVVGLREDIDDLTKSIDSLVQTVDDLRADFEWALKNEKPRAAPAPLTVTSMPKDPLSAGFGERVNRYSAGDLPPELGEVNAGVSSHREHQRDLF